MSEDVLDVKGEAKVTASTRRNRHPRETFSSVRLFESCGLKRLGFSSWIVGYRWKLCPPRSAFCSGAFRKRCFAEEPCHSACLKRFWIDVRTLARSTFLQKETPKSSVSVSMQTLDSDVPIYNKERRCHLLTPLVSQMWRQVLSPPIFPVSST